MSLEQLREQILQELKNAVRNNPKKTSSVKKKAPEKDAKKSSVKAPKKAAPKEKESKEKKTLEKDAKKSSVKVPKKAAPKESKEKKEKKTSKTLEKDAKKSSVKVPKKASKTLEKVVPKKASKKESKEEKRGSGESKEENSKDEQYKKTMFEKRQKEQKKFLGDHKDNSIKVLKGKKGDVEYTITELVGGAKSKWKHTTKKFNPTTEIIEDGVEKVWVKHSRNEEYKKATKKKLAEMLRNSVEYYILSQGIKTETYIPADRLNTYISGAAIEATFDFDIDTEKDWYAFMSKECIYYMKKLLEAVLLEVTGEEYNMTALDVKKAYEFLHPADKKKSVASGSQKNEDCEEGKIWSPKSKRCIKIDGRAGKLLLEEQKSGKKSSAKTSKKATVTGSVSKWKKADLEAYVREHGLDVEAKEGKKAPLRGDYVRIVQAHQKEGKSPKAKKASSPKAKKALLKRVL